MKEFDRSAMWAMPRTTASDKPSASHPNFAATKNQILAALPEADLARLLPNLEPIFLPVGMTLRDAGVIASEVYFLDTGIVCQLHIASDGETTSLALIGREGMIGIESFLGEGSMPMRSVMLCNGHAYRINTNVLIEEFNRSSSMRCILLRYAQALLTQVRQTGVCNRDHSIEKRLSRFLLLCLDRMPLNELAMTQDLIAILLGVPRIRVTEAATKLQHVRAIDYRRGHISVVDRAGLAAHSCECYAAVEKEYLHLTSAAHFPPDRSSASVESDAFIAPHLSRVEPSGIK